ncbi:MAG: Nucleoid-associated protein [Deltaproteobacteria bacterium ADurb.Bin510]|nr:MAG: Nucleoid-associated protein [Deltaproteobacteria bacterium ADurb.Bin510]
MNITDLLKQAQNMQGKLKELEDKLGHIHATGEAGGGMVSVTMNGRLEIENLTLDPICVDNRDVPMLQDLIIAALNQALDKIKEQGKQELAGLTAGLPLNLFK